MEPSAGLNPQANPAVNQEILTPSMSVSVGMPLFLQCDGAPSIDCRNRPDTAIAAEISPIDRPTLLSGCSTVMANFAMHEDSTQRAALSGSMSGAAEQDAGCTQAPISILVFHRRKTGRGLMPRPPLSQTSIPVPAMPGVSEGAAFFC